MNYALLIYLGSQALAMRRDPKQLAAYLTPWMAYARAVVEAGIHVGGTGLELPETATTVRLQDGQRNVQDGPFAETKELVGGRALMECRDQAEAVEWTKRFLAIVGDGESMVRPVYMS